MLHTARSVQFIKRNMVYNQLECPVIFHFFEARMIYKKTYGQRVMNYAGSTKAPFQRTLICTQTYVSWVGAQPVTLKQRLAASVTNRPLPSDSRSAGTVTRVADVKKTVASVKSSPPKKSPKSSKPSSPRQHD